NRSSSRYGPSDSPRRRNWSSRPTWPRPLRRHVEERRPHPDLHSFPTRRSSDLTAIRSRTIAWTKPRLLITVATTVSSNLGFVQRSEEHTSELQSRSDLVCRLLLEKKKNNLTTTPPPRTTTSATTA